MKASTRTVFIIAGCLIGAGLLLQFIGWAAGNQKAREEAEAGQGELLQDSQSFTQVQFLFLDAEIGSITLDADARLEAGQVQVAYRLPQGTKILLDQEGSALHMEVSMERSSNPDNFLGLWGWLNTRPFLNWASPDSTDMAIHVSYGPDTEFAQASLRLDLGELSMASCRIKDLTIESDLGSASLVSVQAEKADIQLDLGNLDAQDCILANASMVIESGAVDCLDVQTKDISIVAGLGNIHMQGKLEGKNDFQCDLGSLSIQTDLPSSLYDLDLQTDLGSVTLDGRSLGSSVQQNTKAAHSICAVCNLGSIDLDFS